MSLNIEHRGVIRSMKNGMAEVEITQLSACAGCHAKGVCSAADKKEKLIEIPYTDDSLKTGDTVLLHGTQTMETQALLLAFVYPFLLLLATLVITLCITNDEMASGIASLLILVPYYIYLYINKKRLRKKFIFTMTSADSAEPSIQS